MAAICCGVASFSSAQGLVSWLAVVPSVLALRGTSLSRRTALTAWLLLFACTAAVYLVDYHPQRGSDIALPVAEARLGLWAIPGAAVIMCGRAHFGAGHALESPRYTTVAILLLIASLQLSFAFVPWNVHEGWRGFTALPPRCSWR